MKLHLILLFIVCPMVAFSQTMRKVTTEYTYYAPENESLEQAKTTALLRAKIQIIADEFGTMISQTNYTSISTVNNKSEVDFQSIGMSDLRGEWIETLEDPAFEISYIDNMICVFVRVKGIIRQINNDYAKITTKLLRNSTDLRFESMEFHDKDDLFLYFTSPVVGYLSVYLLDNSNNAFCLLPYARQSEGIFKVEANKEYIFFSKECTSLLDKTLVDEYIMTCNGTKEYNKIAIIFSENKFIKSADAGLSENMPRMLPLKDFNLWLAKARNKDLNMQYQEISFTIKP